MKPKKNKKADLEGWRSTFFMFGLALTLLIVWQSFEFRVSMDKADSMEVVVDLDIDDELVPITRDKPKDPPPPPAPAPKVADVLTIVDNDEEIDEELEIEDSEADQNEAVEIQVMVVEEENEVEDENQVFVIVEDMPYFKFKGEKGQVNPKDGIAVQKWILSRIKYPVIAQENGITGKVYLNFTVSKTGAVENVRVIRGVDPSLDNEAVRVVESMPIWTPGKQRGKPVNVSYNVPINFQLQ